MDKVQSSVQRVIKTSFNKMILNEFETCSVCGYQIPRSEQAFVFKGNIVCLECDNKLRRKLNLTVDIPNIEYKIKNNIKKGAKKMNVDTEFNTSSKFGAFGKIKISDDITGSGNDDIRFNEIETEEDYNNSSDELVTATSRTNSQKVKIQLPPIIRSYFIERNSLAIEPQPIKRYRAVGGFVILICIIGILAVGAMFASRYFL